MPPAVSTRGGGKRALRAQQARHNLHNTGAARVQLCTIDQVVNVAVVGEHHGSVTPTL